MAFVLVVNSIKNVDLDFTDHQAAMTLPQVAQEDQRILKKPWRWLSRYVNTFNAPEAQNADRKYHGWPPAIMNFCEMQMKQSKSAIISENPKVGHKAA